MSLRPQVLTSSPPAENRWLLECRAIALALHAPRTTNTMTAVPKPDGSRLENCWVGLELSSPMTMIPAATPMLISSMLETNRPTEEAMPAIFGEVVGAYRL